MKNGLVKRKKENDMAKMSKGWKTFLMITIPLTVAGIVILVVNKKKSSGLVKTDIDPKNPPPPKQAAAPSTFPLKKGSKNDLVKQMQQYLGVTDDGIFGPITESALKQATGKTSIASQDDYNSFVAAMQAKAATVAASSLATKMYSDYEDNEDWVVYVKNAFDANQYNVDAYGTYIATGKSKRVPANTQFARASIDMNGVGSSGLLRVYVTDYSSTLDEGNYLFDPNNITLIQG